MTSTKNAHNINRRTAIAGLAIVGASGSIAQSKIKLSFAHGTAEDNPRHTAAMRFAALVAKGTGGRLTVEVSPNAKLADDGAALDKLVDGSIDLSANSQGPLAKFIPELAALGLPYVFSTPQQVWRVLRGPIGEELKLKAASKGFVVLGFWDNGFRHITNSKRPIYQPVDLKGLKLRTPADNATIDFVKALGGEPQTVKFSELKAALAEGKVDGQENPLINIYTAKLAEVQKYLSLSNHKYETTPLLISKVTWNRLSAADRAVISDAAEQATTLQRNLMLKSEERTFSRLLAAGMLINQVETSVFAKASQPVIDSWSAGPVGEFTKRLITAAKMAHIDYKANPAK
jgi:TRAP-type transport system periplasmic protein